MSTPEEPVEPQPISIRRWLLLGLGILVAAMVVLFLARVAYEQSVAGKRLDSLLSDLDETDPNWRLDEIEATRPDPIESKNSARVVMAAVKLIPKTWANDDFDLKVGLSDLPAPERLDAVRMKLVEDELAKASTALEQARRLADMPEGRHHLIHSPNPLVTLLPDQQDTRRVAHLLSFDACQLAQAGDIDGALRSCRALLNAGRSLADEPIIISQLVRVACVATSTSAAERVLALGEASDRALAQWQELPELEEKHPSMLVAMRGERAMMYKLLVGLGNGTIPTRGLLDMVSTTPADGWRDYLFGVSRREVRQQFPLMMRMMNRMVEIARMPAPQQREAQKGFEREFEKELRNSRVARMLVPAVQSIGNAFRRKLALVSTMRVLVACERYRLKNGKWPQKLDDLVGTFLDAVPRDPYDGLPLRYRQLPDGVAVYTLGEDGVDNGGVLDRKSPMGLNKDLGYRLWNVKNRRRAATLRPIPEVTGPIAGIPPGARPMVEGAAPAPPAKKQEEKKE